MNTFEKPLCVFRESNRHGKTYYYFRKGKGLRIRLPNPEVVGPHVFNEAYEAVCRGEPVPTSALPAPVTAKACSVQGCGNLNYYAYGWCEPHYRRWRRFGSPTPGGKPRASRAKALKYLLEVVLAYEGDNCFTWQLSRDKNGYGILTKGGVKWAHRVVCKEVNGSPPTPRHQAAHSCGKGHVHRVNKRHLRWATPKENSADKAIHGTANGREPRSAALADPIEPREA